MSEPAHESTKFTFCERYLPGLLQLAPVEFDLTDRMNDRDSLMEPENSRTHLAAVQCGETRWNGILDSRGQSHEVRALIITALGSSTRSLLVLKINLRILDELDGVIKPMGDVSERVITRTSWHTPAVQQRLAE